MSVAVESAVAPVAPAEEPDICCICCDVETPEASFVKPGPCKCKGSIKFHIPCLLQAMQHSAMCGACKAPFTDPEFIGMQKRTLKPEEEVIMSTSRCYSDAKNAIIYYKADEAGVEQGTAYVFVEYTNWEYTGFYYFATIDFTNGVINGEVVVAGDYSKSPRLSKQKDMVFTVNAGEVCGAFIRYRIYSSVELYQEQQIAERGCWLPNGALIGLHEVRDWVRCDMYNEEFIIVKRATYKEDGSGQLEDGEHMLRSEKDPNSVIFADYKGGQLHGKWASYKNRRNGSAPTETRHYKNGVLHGLRTRYEPSRDSVTPSSPIQEIMYKDGFIHGMVRIYELYMNKNWDKAPRLVAEGNYKAGMPVGVQRVFTNGRLYEETTLAADGSGLLDGVCTYYADGAIYQRASFKMGVLDGFLRFYDNRGVERVRILMKDGRPKEGSRATYFDASGSVEEECKVEYGAFLADFLEEGTIVRQNETVTANGLGDSVDVQLYEVVQEPEQRWDEERCYCGMCYRSSRDDYDSDDDDYDRDNYYERRYRRGYYD